MGFCALLHDTHHRAYTNPAEILRLHLQRFDGVLAFGEAIRRIYPDGFGVRARLDVSRGGRYQRLSASGMRARRQDERCGLDRQLGRRGAHRRS